MYTGQIIVAAAMPSAGCINKFDYITELRRSDLDGFVVVARTPRGFFSGIALLELIF